MARRVELSTDERQALVCVRACYGRTWKAWLAMAWTQSRYIGIPELHHARLQSLRNRIGNSGLYSISL